MSTIAIGKALFVTIAATLAQPADAPAFDLQSRAAAISDKALAFLAAHQQPDGGWVARQTSNPAITALCAKAFIQSPHYGPGHPIVQRAIAFMLTFAKDDGGIYVDGEGHRNYQTSVCLMTLAALKDPEHTRRIRAAQEFLSTLQWDESEGYERDHPWYGGAGYGRGKRPDLSNTQMMLEALHDSGLPKDHPVFKKALTFIGRCQMNGLTNDQPFAKFSDDGGFVYSPANDGESKAGRREIEGNSRLRSYGSMTYAGFKSMLYAGLDRDDDRVKAALQWIREHYTLDSNPNMPGAQSREGLYYYYLVFARAFDAWGEDVITDSAGSPHRWREELCGALERLQRPDGSFVNEVDRWMEGNPYLVTAYSVLALQAAVL